MGGEDKVGEEAGGRRVGVLYVERGVGEGGGAEVRVELQATGGGLTTGGEETVLTEVSVVGAGGGGDGASYDAGDKAASYGMASKRSGGGDVGGGGGDDAGVLIRLHLTTKSFGGKEGAVSWGGAGVAEGLEPEGDVGESVGGKGEEGAAQTCAVWVTGWVASEVTTPSGDDICALLWVGDVGGAEGRGGE